SSEAAPAKERLSATLAKIASASKSGSFDIAKPETMSFGCFYFYSPSLSISLVPENGRTPPKEHPMIDVRPFNSLGGADHGWLKAKHHFSFADYQDPKRVQWGNLRVWNDDEIAPNTGFPPHPHANMEIITYVRKGA